MFTLLRKYNVYFNKLRFQHTYLKKFMHTQKLKKIYA